MFLPKLYFVVLICVTSVFTKHIGTVLKKHSYYKTSVNEVMLDNSNIEEIEPEAFKDSSINILRISGSSNLKEIKKGIFVNVSVHEMLLYDNDIRLIEPGSFQDLRPLDMYGIYWFSAENNKLESIQKGVFSNTKFRKIYLSNNKIKYIEAGSFDGMSHLLSIDLDGNSLENIDVGVFQKISPDGSWIDLSLNNNLLRYIHPNAFEDTTIYSLSLEGNNLTFTDKSYFQKTTIGDLYI